MKIFLILLGIVFAPLCIHILLGLIFNHFGFSFNTPESHASFFSATMTYSSIVGMFVIAFCAPYFIQRRIDKNTKQKELLYNKLKKTASLINECQKYIRDIEGDNNFQKNKENIKIFLNQIGFETNKIIKLVEKMIFKIKIQELQDLNDKYFKSTTEDIENIDFTFNSVYKNLTNKIANEFLQYIEERQFELL